MVPEKQKQRLIEAVVAQHFRQGVGIHGVAHWRRVEANGHMLAEVTGADKEIVTWFAYLHDARRLNDSHDPEHGWRGARLAEELNDEFMQLDPAYLKILVKACEGHTIRRTHKDRTIATCWDGDRLDLVRLGMEIQPEGLATQEAADKKMIRAAQERFEQSLLTKGIEQSRFWK